LNAPKKILVIQTAFIGDVILVTALLEDVHHHFPEAKISILVRHGNEIFFREHPFVKHVLIWHKNKGKYRALLGMVKTVRGLGFDCVLNVHRYFASGLITFFSKAKWRVGFDSNPFSFDYTHKVNHGFKGGMHEVQRNAKLLQAISQQTCLSQPKLYPSNGDYVNVKKYTSKPYLTISPKSIWFTKSAPSTFWLELIERYHEWPIFFLGSAADHSFCDELLFSSKMANGQNLCGALSLMESAALMSEAVMNFSNDSAPMHLCSAMNAPVTAVYCSTVPSFGFGPLSNQSMVLETDIALECRPCGLHGHQQCPKGHFKCGKLDVTKIVLPA
jgi:ADP-heptose:LPS heptosyltransferase